MEMCRWLKEGTVRSEKVKDGAMEMRFSQKDQSSLPIAPRMVLSLVGSSGSMILKIENLVDSDCDFLF